jgi:hypothetical protein
MTEFTEEAKSLTSIQLLDAAVWRETLSVELCRSRSFVNLMPENRTMKEIFPDLALVLEQAIKEAESPDGVTGDYARAAYKGSLAYSCDSVR